MPVAYRRPTKYRAIPTVADGYRFASKKEAARYGELKLMARAGEIVGLELQPRFPIAVNGVRICAYVGDFQYIQEGRFVVEDCKGYRTREYQIKKKLVFAVYGVAILET